MADFITNVKQIPKPVRIIAEAGQSFVDGVMTGVPAMEIGAAIGTAILPGVGTAIGAVFGFLAGVIGAMIPHAIHIQSIINEEDDPQHTVQSALQRPAEIIKMGMEPMVDKNGVVRSMINDMANSHSTMRGIMNSYGVTMMGNVVRQRGIASMSNRSSNDLGMHPVTASAMADPTNRVMLAKMGGRSSTNFYSGIDQVYQTAYNINLQNLSSRQQPMSAVF